MVGFVWVKGDRCRPIPVASVARPPFWVLISCGLEDSLPLLQDGDVTSIMAFAGGDETYAAVAVFVVVPRDGNWPFSGSRDYVPRGQTLKPFAHATGLFYH